MVRMTICSFKKNLPCRPHLAAHAGVGAAGYLHPGLVPRLRQEPRRRGPRPGAHRRPAAGHAHPRRHLRGPRRGGAVQDQLLTTETGRWRPRREDLRC